MSDSDFHLPGSAKALDDPQTYVTGVLRNFEHAAQVLGAAVDRLVLRLAAGASGRGPDYQIQTIDGEDAAAFSGSTRDFLSADDFTRRIDESDLLDQRYTIEQAKDWLNRINGEVSGGVSPGLSNAWLDRDESDPRE